MAGNHNDKASITVYICVHEAVYIFTPEVAFLKIGRMLMRSEGGSISSGVRYKSMRSRIDDEQENVVNGMKVCQPSFLPARQATLKLDKAIEYEIKHGRKLDTQMDRKKLRRTVSNRLSAQRSRQRRAQHILDMERKANELEVTLLLMEEKSTRLQEKRRLLKEQNEALQQLLHIRQHQANHSQIVLEKNKAELNRLREVLLSAKGSSSRCSRTTGLIYEDEEHRMDNEDASFSA